MAFENDRDRDYQTYQKQQAQQLPSYLQPKPPAPAPAPVQPAAPPTPPPVPQPTASAAVQPGGYPLIPTPAPAPAEQYAGIENGSQFFPNGQRNPMYLPQTGGPGPFPGSSFDAWPTPPAAPPEPEPVNPEGEYYSDIAQLRSMPQGLVDAYKKYIETAQAQPKYTGMAEAEAQRLNTDPADFGNWQNDINYLRETPGKGEYEQSFLTSAAENVDRKYGAAARNIIENASRRGLEPSSGIVQSELNKLEQAKAQEKAGAERELAMWRMGESRSRRTEARNVGQQLEALRSGNRGRAIGLQEAAENAVLGRRGMETGLYKEIDAMEQQRRAAARGVEGQLDEQDRQRLMDLMGYLQGAQPSSTPAALASQSAANAQQNANQAGASFGAGLGNTSQSLLYYQLLNNPDLMNKWFPPKPAPVSE